MVGKITDKDIFNADNKTAKLMTGTQVKSSP
jgi:hypothetical protein